MFEQFYLTFFKSIEEVNPSAKQSLWDHCFPENWKVTKDNLENDESKLFSDLSWRCFFNWVMDRINKSNEKRDIVLGEVAHNLFPGIDSNLFLELLVIYTSGSNKGNNVKRMIENPWDFGFYLEIKLPLREIPKEEMMQSISEKEMQKENNTFELVLLLFNKEVTSKINIQEYIEEIKKLEYAKDSKEELERIELLETFEKFLQYVTEQEN